MPPSILPSMVPRHQVSEIRQDSKRIIVRSTWWFRLTQEKDGLTLKLEELKVQYDKEWTRNNVLDTKATTTITIAGTIITLIFGFVTFAQSTATNAELIISPLVQGLILTSIIFGIISILCAVHVLWIRDYAYLTEIKDYFRNPSAKFSLDSINSTTTYEDLFNTKKIVEKKQIGEIMASYILSIKVFAQNNENKSRSLIAAVSFLVFSVFTTGSISPTYGTRARNIHKKRYYWWRG